MHPRAGSEPDAASDTVAPSLRLTSPPSSLGGVAADAVSCGTAAAAAPFPGGRSRELAVDDRMEPPAKQAPVDPPANAAQPGEPVRVEPGGSADPAPSAAVTPVEPEASSANLVATEAGLDVTEAPGAKPAKPGAFEPRGGGTEIRTRGSSKSGENERN